jgi:hypothetical protein
MSDGVSAPHGSLSPHFYLLNAVVPDAIKTRPVSSHEFDAMSPTTRDRFVSSSLSLTVRSSREDLLGQMLLRLLLQFSKTRPTMIVLHLKVCLPAA